jgi:hypothetical protein
MQPIYFDLAGRESQERTQPSMVTKLKYQAKKSKRPRQI